MKINVAQIVRDHWATLYNVEKNRISYGDILLFYAIPIVIAAIGYCFDFKVKTEGYNVSITFFGIFVALLLNIQVAIFAIFQRRWEEPGSEREATMQHNALAVRRTLLGELNSNISYLTVVSCVALTSVLLFLVLELTEGTAPAITIAIYAHFLLTFLMIIKRAYSLFQKEYAG